MAENFKKLYVDLLEKNDATKHALEVAETALKECRDSLREQREISSLAKNEMAAAKVLANDTRALFTDMKKKLHAAHQANQFMRGYLARVHEDDVVREELLTVGDPEGGQRMVPKRKPTEFERAEEFMEPIPEKYGHRAFGEPMPTRRHFIEY